MNKLKTTILIILMALGVSAQTPISLFNPSTRGTAVWQLNNTTLVSGKFGPTIPLGWYLIDQADLNGDGKLDYELFNPTTRQTAIWYLDSDYHIKAGGYGPTLPAGWVLHSALPTQNPWLPARLLITNPSTGELAAISFSGTNILNTVKYPTIPAGWFLVSGKSDANNDGQLDLLLLNPSTGKSAVWLMNGNIRIGSYYGPTIPAGWMLADFVRLNGDGFPDYILSHFQTLAAWYLNNLGAFIGGAYLPTLPASWALSCTAAKPCTFGIKPTAISGVSKGGGFYYVNVSTLPRFDCKWDAVSNSSFVTVSHLTGWVGSGSVPVAVAANPNANPRTGYITIAKQVIPIYQDGTVSPNLAGNWTGTIVGVFSAGSCSASGSHGFSATLRQVSYYYANPASSPAVLTGIFCWDLNTCGLHYTNGTAIGNTWLYFGSDGKYHFNFSGTIQEGACGGQPSEWSFDDGVLINGKVVGHDSGGQTITLQRAN
jgi:hypothetical protein